jgi:hypothetical protein
MVNGPLVAVRAIHFAATLILAGQIGDLQQALCAEVGRRAASL